MRPDPLCANWILDETAKVQVVGIVPVGHHRVVCVDRHRIHHHGLVEIAKVVECVNGLAVIYRLVHHDRIVEPAG